MEGNYNFSKYTQNTGCWVLPYKILVTRATRRSGTIYCVIAAMIWWFHTQIIF